MASKNHSDAINFRKNIRSYNSSFAMAAFWLSRELSFQEISCVNFKGDGNVTAATSLNPVNNQNHRFAQIYIQDNDSALSSRISDGCVLPGLAFLQK